MYSNLQDETKGVELCVQIGAIRYRFLRPWLSLWVWGFQRRSDGACDCQWRSASHHSVCVARWTCCL